MTHIDDWIEYAVCKNDPGVRYAAFVLHNKRLSASAQIAFADFVGDLPLFCDYGGKRMRCTGASRMGDVWLTENHNRTHGYDLRVDVDVCENWGDSPDGNYAVLRREQAQRVMPSIGGLLDAWESMTGDAKESAEHLSNHIAAIWKGMECS